MQKTVIEKEKNMKLESSCCVANQAEMERNAMKNQKIVRFFLAFE